MKKIFLKPGFEFIFALSILIIFCVPLLVLGQNNKDVKIIINNGDTTINGKKLSDMSAADHREALKEFSRDHGSGNQFKSPGHGRPGDMHGFNFRRRDSSTFKTDTGKRRMLRLFFADGRRMDSSKREFANSYRNFREGDRKPNDGRGFNNGDHMPMMRFRGDDHAPGSMRGREPEGRPRRTEGPNSQSNSFMHVDKDGIATHVNFSVSDASHNHMNILDLDDLNIIPEFSSGKTVLMFSLPVGKIAADVKLADSDGKVLWTDKMVNGSFSKTFSMPLNGIYYLTVKQGIKTSVKKIVKR